MLVYGDIESTETVGVKQDTIQGFLSEAGRLPAGIRRHEALVNAFIAASELVQSLVDADFQERGFDAASVVHETGMRCLSILAHAVEQSWRTGSAPDPLPEAFFETLLGFDPSRTVRTKSAEGYAFYALYPESYLEAARRSALGRDVQVIGIRSIGAGLSALVAAALGAPPPVTLRPVGHPFGREVKVDPALTERLTADKDRVFAVVDEGPGLSGSSFGAVADWLEAAGIPRQQIHFFPSHGGAPGPQASERHRERWSVASRHLVTMDDLLLHAPSRPLETWVEEILGPLDRPLEEISGGAWRMKRYADETRWPPAHVQQERRKFLAHARGSSWLVKFAGLGAAGRRKADHARQLHEAGFAPEPAGYRHGFLVERWHEDAQGLDQVPVDRDLLVERVGAYLGFRARHFPVGDDQGASLSELRRMAVYNAGQALGENAATALDRILGSPEPFENRVRRVCTDSRMHAWEWLVCGGRVIKADALDHCAAHDLVGHQDIAWDVVGAAVELDLTQEEVSRLCIVIRQESGHPVADELLAFLRPCYLAFQMGAALMAAGALGEGPEAWRLRRAADRYAGLLQGRGYWQEQVEVSAS